MYMNLGSRAGRGRNKTLLVDDTAPQLGGDLDLNGHSIPGVTDALSAIATVAPPGDGVRLIAEVTIAEDDDALEVSGASFVAEDVGKLIVIHGAGDGGATLVSTISAVTDSENITLADNAGTTLNAAETSVAYGTDMLAVLQGLIDSLPADGGEIILTGKYLLSDDLNIGDGTSTTVSTRAGVRLRGVGAPQVLRDWVQPADAQDEVIYAGAGGAGSGVININGPLSGWGVKNLGIDGSLLADHGLTLMSAGLGRTDDLFFRGCRMRSLNFDCYSNSGYSGLVSANTDLIVGDNIVIDLPDVAHTLGIMCDGPADGTASTCFVELGNVRIYMKSNQPAYGVYRRVADTVRIKNLLIIANSEVHASAYGVVDDYTKNPSFPSGCVLDTPDVGWNIPEWRQFVASGTPSSSARPNKICNLSELNGCRYPVGLVNTDLDLPALVGGKVSLTGQNSAITTTAILTPRRAGLYRVTYYMKVTAAGSAGTLTFNAVSHDPEVAAVPGQPVDVTTLNAHDQGSLVVYADGSNPIYYAVTAGGLTAGSLEYRLDAVVERLC